MTEPIAELTQPIALQALNLANSALQFYLISDICVKDLSYKELYSNLKQLVCLLQNATNLHKTKDVFNPIVDCDSKLSSVPKDS